MMTLVFDLDDTLYVEKTYVESGFRAVARFLERKYGMNADEAFHIMLRELEVSGRGKVFDTVLKHGGIYRKKHVRACLHVYRTHHPTIRLSDEAVNCLKRFESWTKYVVTDGNKHVQRNKIRALGLYRQFKRCISTYGYGVRNSKPSPKLFQEICRWEQTDPHNVVYIGDNPKKDFVGIRPLGFRTIRVLTGPFRSLQLDEGHEADLQIRSLEELTPDLLTTAFSLEN